MKHRKAKHPIIELSKDMLNIGAGGMIAGAGTSALGSMGAPSASVGGLATASSFMPAIGRLVGTKAVLGMMARFIPRRRRRR